MHENGVYHVDPVDSDDQDDQDDPAKIIMILLNHDNSANHDDYANHADNSLGLHTYILQNYQHESRSFVLAILSIIF